MPPAAWNCSSATTSSMALIGDQKKSGSPQGFRPLVERFGREDGIQLADELDRVGRA